MRWIFALALIGSTAVSAQQRVDSSGSAGLQSNGALNSSAWVARAHRPPATELACTDFSSLFWSVSLKRGNPQATKLPVRAHVDALPFRLADGPDLQGNRYVEAVPGGWIVGFDAGEFGGGLWWFNANGTQSRRIRPEAAQPVSRDEEHLPENIVGLPIVGDKRLVLMGLDHLTARSGRIFRLVQHGQGWRLDPVARLDGEPDVWFVDGNRLLFLTRSGLWAIGPTRTATRLYQIDIGSFSPSAMVRATDGSLYIGLRQYVLKLDQSNGGWHETWFTPAACLKVEMKDGRCECIR